MTNIAVFLDRDGTIIEDPGYISKWDKELIIPGSVEAIKTLNRNNFKVIVVTNQAGVAYGYYTEEDMILFNKLMKEELESQGVHIDGIYYCCHGPTANCDCRKPRSGMLLRAASDFNISLKKSWMIGDKKSDIDTGKTVGCMTVLVLTGHGTRELENYDDYIECDFVAENLYDAVKKMMTTH